MATQSSSCMPETTTYTTSYWSAIVNITLSCTIFELFGVKNNTVTLKSGLDITHGHRNWYHSKAWVWLLFAVALSGTIS